MVNGAGDNIARASSPRSSKSGIKRVPSGRLDKRLRRAVLPLTGNCVPVGEQCGRVELIKFEIGNPTACAHAIAMPSPEEISGLVVY